MGNPFTRAIVFCPNHEGGSEPYRPPDLPRRWKEYDLGGATGFCYFDGLKVICSVSVELDGLRWLHVSASRERKIPSWGDLRAVKDIFVGREAKAIMVFPPKSEWINDNPFVLHIWQCLDGDPCPDFRKGGTI